MNQPTAILFSRGILNEIGVYIEFSIKIALFMPGNMIKNIVIQIMKT